MINPVGLMPTSPKMYWLLAASSLLVFSTPFLSAQSENSGSPQSPTRNSVSPDGSKEVIFRWTNPRIEGAGNIYIHILRTNKFLGPLPWVGFGYPYETLWRTDGTAFAVKGEWARGYVVCRVYLMQRNGQYCLVKTPELVRCVADKYHLETYGKGGEHPVEWLPGNRLAVDVYDRSWGPKDQGDVEQPYRVTLRLPTDSGVKSLKAAIQDIRPIDIP